jgi:hypothetical protein
MIYLFTEVMCYLDMVVGVLTYPIVNYKCIVGGLWNILRSCKLTVMMMWTLAQTSRTVWWAAVESATTPPRISVGGVYDQVQLDTVGEAGFMLKAPC